jgi:ribosomal protein S18 acetylase RimI-like enzyme
LSTRERFFVGRARPEDTASLLECLRAAFEPYRALYTPAAFEDTVLTPDTVGERLRTMVVFVAVAASVEVIGTVACHLVGEREGHLRGMAVLPSWQGRGVAEELLGAAESELRRAGCGRVSLDTRRPLGRAVRFYETHGFCPTGRVNDFFGMELFEYAKPLGPTDMEPTRNDLGQPIGFPLPGWSAPPAPPREPMEGRFCRLEPLNPGRHTAALFEADAADVDGRSWTYLAYGPFRTLAEYRAWMGTTCLGNDPLFFAILDLAGGMAAGVASYLRVTPAAGSIEVGHIHYSPRLQRSLTATEAMFLMMRWAFETFHKVLNSGCQAEQSKLRTAERLTNLLAVLCVVGWRVFWLTMVNRETPDAPAEAALTAAEIEILDRVGTAPPATPAPPRTIAHYLVAVAKRGGYLARAKDPPPGNLVVWSGLTRLADILLGFELGNKGVGN